MIRTNKFPVPNLIRPQHVLVSTFFKDKLEGLVEDILAANPQAMFYSTGGTGGKLREIMGSKAETNYMSVEDFTGCPEMEGGLVKTLHPKIHAGLLAERNNPEHQRFLEVEMAKFGKGPGVYFDIFVGNLYPFMDAVKNDGGSAEVARCYIDIGGPTMIMAAAKNWHSVSNLTSPDTYKYFGQVLAEDKGYVSAEYRFALAVEALRVIALFRGINYHHFSELDFGKDVLPTINLI